MTVALLEDLAARGLHARQGLLFVVDGSKAIAAAVAQVFGEHALVQRCQVHKRRNVVEHLPKREQGWVNLRLSTSWAQGDAVRAKQDLDALAKELDVKYPGAAASLREGLEQTLTVQRLGLPAQLRQRSAHHQCHRGSELTAAQHRPPHLALHHRRPGTALGQRCRPARRATPLSHRRLQPPADPGPGSRGLRQPPRRSYSPCELAGPRNRASPSSRNHRRAFTDYVREGVQ